MKQFEVIRLRETDYFDYTNYVIKMIKFTEPGKNNFVITTVKSLKDLCYYVKDHTPDILYTDLPTLIPIVNNFLKDIHNQKYSIDKLFIIVSDISDDLAKHPCISYLHAYDKNIGYLKKVLNQHGELTYLNVLQEVMENGHLRNTRNGATYSLFSKQISFDVSESFPLLTTKKMFLRGIFEELKFFIQGKTDTKELSAKGVRIWEGNTSKSFIATLPKNKNFKEYDMGKMYGYQWRNFNGQEVDQLQDIIDLLKTDRYSRRIILTTYNPAQKYDGVLFPCHGISIQFYVNEQDKLNCAMYQRSGDIFLGVPFNIASYALFMIIIGKIVGLQPGILTIFLGDVHLYKEHVEQCKEQLGNVPFQFPKLTINRKLENLNDINSLEFSDLVLDNYLSHGKISAQMVS